MMRYGRYVFLFALCSSYTLAFAAQEYVTADDVTASSAVAVSKPSAPKQSSSSAPQSAKKVGLTHTASIKAKQRLQTVKQAFFLWVNAMESATKGDATLLKQLYSPRAIILPTFSPRILTSNQPQFADYLKKLSNIHELKIQPVKLATEIYGNTAINTGFYNFYYVTGHQKAVALAATFTFVYQKVKDQWLIVQQQSSITARASKSAPNNT